MDKIIFDVITHGRADIWTGYADLLKHSSLSNVLFGFRGHELPYISVWGGTTLINHPHSSYLRMLLNYGILIYLFFIFSFYQKVKNIEDRKATFIVLAIMIAAITNINVFYNDNPVYLMTFFVFSQNNLYQIT